MSRSSGRHFLQIPGPTNTPLSILAAIAKPTIDHRGPEFATLGLDVLKRIRSVFKTEAPVIIYPTSGTGAWEAALANTLSPGDGVLMFETGWFSTLWSKMVTALGLRAEIIPGDWRSGVRPEQIAEKLLADREHEYKAVAVVHNETSTGVKSNIEAVRRAIDDAKHPALLLVDTISSLGSMDYRHDQWRADVTVCGSQKGLMLPPGLGFNAVSAKAVQASKTARLTRSFLGWDDMLASNAQGFFPYTPSTNLLQGLKVALDLIEAEGLTNIFTRHDRAALATRRAVERWGFEVQCRNETEHSSSLTAVRLPQGHSADALRRQILQDANLSLGNGLGPLADRVFRIGHLGDFSDASVLGTLAAIEMGLKAQGGLTNAETGLIFGAFSWAYLGSVIFGGWGARKFGAKSTLAVCVVIVGVGTIATGLAGGLATLFVARLMVGMGEGPAFPAATQAMRNWYPPDRFGYIQGITHSASRLGAALAPPIATAVILWAGWRSAFVVCGAAALIWCAAWWIIFRDDPRQHPSFDPGRWKNLAVSLPDRRAKIPLLLLTNRMSSVTLVMFAYGWTYWVFVSWLPLYFVNRHHTDLKSSALLTSALFFAGLVGNSVGGIVSDRILRTTGRNRLARCSVILVSLLGAAALITPTMFCNDLRIVVPLLAGAMFFLELTIAPMYAIPMDVSKEYAGLGSAYVIMGVGLAGIVSPVVFGWLIDLTGNWNVPFATGVAILLLGAAAVPLLRPDLPLLIPSDPQADSDDLHQLAASPGQLR